MKARNTKTGKVGRIIKETDTHYIVQFDDGKKSRWVKRNSIVYSEPHQQEGATLEKEALELRAVHGVGPALETVAEDSALEQIADHVEQCLLTLGSIAIDIEKISQAIPFPEEFELDLETASKVSEWPRDVVDYMVPGDCMTFLLGRPQSGKTLMALRIAESVALGKPFLDRRVSKGNVLFLADEALTLFLNSVPDDLTFGKPEDFYHPRLDRKTKEDPLKAYDLVVVDASYNRKERLNYWCEYSSAFNKPVLFTMLCLPRGFDLKGRNMIFIDNGRLVLSGKNCASIPVSIINGEYALDRKCEHALYSMGEVPN